MASDCLKTPLRNNSCDHAISIAVIHHLSTLDRRKAAIREIVRILNTGGKALIYVWAMEQKVNNEQSKYISTKRNEELSVNLTENTEEKEEKTIDYHVNRTEFMQQDLFVPFSKKPQNVKKSQQSSEIMNKMETYYRFYHLFLKGELEQLCVEACSNVEIVDSYYDDGNWCVILRKL
ncbi:alkylated DNA repair protein alkB homolog 8-like [Symsagittifera roscoffensis]|uniref:alkylated DNA repair protein alkB homolog 8-like n=1 Tax=Symsagittifera roscoffensis TaxID=84072 RepID=UPI00307B83B3